MIPDLLSTLVAIALVCTVVLDAPLLQSHRALLAIGGAVLAILGLIANRRDYLRWPGATTAAAGIAIVLLTLSGLSRASSQTLFWVVFWSGNGAGLVSLWSAFYRGPKISSRRVE